LFIPDLSAGGSERQLVELAKGLSRDGGELLVLTMYDSGVLLAEANAIPGVRVVSLRKKNPVMCAGRLVRTIQRDRIDLLYAFLPTAQVYALAVKYWLPRVKVVYRIGHALARGERFGDRSLRGALVKGLLSLCSRLPDYYVLNSHAAAAAKNPLVPRDRMRVIPNGIDTTRFAPDPSHREALRCPLGVAESTAVVGSVANFTVYKDHATFIEAARLVRAETDDVHFLAIGDDTTALGPQAHERVRSAGLEHCFTFLGPRRDVEAVLPACDIGCSSSISEGFPNAICELMACGVPCIVTDVGDSSAIVGGTGVTVPPSDPRALADGILRLVRLPREERAALGARARSRILDNFSLTRMVSATADVLAHV
jgi:glycosyltransferase involved in cell wall biosynthesis